MTCPQSEACAFDAPGSTNYAGIGGSGYNNSIVGDVDTDILVRKVEDGALTEPNFAIEGNGGNSSMRSDWVSPLQLLPLFHPPSNHIDLSSDPQFSSASFSGQAFDLAGQLLSGVDTASVQSNGFHQSPQPGMDANSDFSFLNRRPASACSQTMRQYVHSRASSSNGTIDMPTTPERTTIKRERVAGARSVSGTTSPLRAQRSLSNKRQRKTASQRNRNSIAATSVRSTSATPTKATSVFANTKKLPLRLPRPPLCLISDPYADLCSHLRRHGMGVEADEFATADGITADFALRGWIQTSVGGSLALLNETSGFLDKHAQMAQMQIEEARNTFNRVLPAQFDFPISDLDVHAEENCLTPTHILAVYGVGSLCKDADPTAEQKGVLIPCHALMYALQCVSLPAFPPSVALQEGDSQRSLPVVSLRVPRPAEYPTLHRFVYTHDASALLVELLPMKHIARHWDHLQTKQQETTQNTNLTAPSSATDALSHLPTQTLLSYAYKVHSAWANGVAIGLLDARFWSTLDRAWNLLMAALSIKKGRVLNEEAQRSCRSGDKARI